MPHSGQPLASLFLLFLPNTPPPPSPQLSPGGGYNDVGERSAAATAELYAALLAGLDKRGIA